MSHLRTCVRCAGTDICTRACVLARAFAKFALMGHAVSLGVVCCALAVARARAQGLVRTLARASFASGKFFSCELARVSLAA